MGHPIRIFQPGIVYSMVSNIVDRQFMFKPDHHPQNPLLSLESPPEALSPDNDIIPKPSVINIIGSAAARAQRDNPVLLHWLDSNIDHPHSGASVEREQQLENIPGFYRDFKSKVARQLNEKWEHEGHVFGGRYRCSECQSEVRAEQQLLYSLTNVVKDGLVESVRRSPFFSCWPALAEGKQLKYWHIDWEAYYLAGGARSKRHRVKDYIRWEELVISPLPWQREWSEDKRQTWVRVNVREMEEGFAAERRREGRPARGVPALYELDPRDRPSKPREKSGPIPRVLASDPEAKKLREEQIKETEQEHREASRDYLAGDYYREFPAGTFRPPIIEPYRPKGRYWSGYV